jgi:(p)ppGpp synthase/HD superfamily hydrolase
MIFSDTIRNAIKLALKTHELHQKQKRKGKDIPYIVHPLIVGMLLSRAGASEDVVAAGILHDTIEDSHPLVPVTAKKIEKMFNAKIAALVVSVTESKRIIAWEERKNDILSRISHYDYDSVLIKSADTLANTTELIHDVEQDGITVFSRFGGSAAAVVSHYCKTINALKERNKAFPKQTKNPFLAELIEAQKSLHHFKEVLSKKHS